MTTQDLHAAETPEHVQETGAELQRSVRQAGRAARSLAETVRALARDTGFVMIGIGDLLVRTLRGAPRMVMEMPARLGAGIAQAPASVGEGLDELLERGQMVAAQVRHDRGLRAAAQTTETARRTARRAVSSVRRAAGAQARVARRSAAALGRPVRSRYQHMAVDELREIASRRQIEGRSRMDKRQLIAALRR